MKRFMKFGLVVLISFSLIACSNKKEPLKEGSGGEIALVTDVGTIDDGSFNQGAWEGVLKYTEEHPDITATYYRPLKQNDDEYFNTIVKAVKDGGAKVVVTPGFLFENAIFRAQKEFPDVHFVLVDGIPKETPSSEGVIADNTNSLLFHEQESGFLAGYAAVKEGFDQLGFIGGLRVPAVVKFGVGYIYGAEYAAKEMGIQVDLRYTYANTFEASPEVQALSAGWYASGTDVIFVTAGGSNKSVFSSAEQHNKKAIGVDSDQREDSETVITSALKQLQGSVYTALTKHFDGSFDGGKAVQYGIDVDAVGLPENLDRFENFTKEDYSKIYETLKADTDGVRSSIATDHANDFSDIQLDNVNLIIN